MIEVKYYNRNGKRARTAQYETAREAFQAMLAAGLEAIASPVGTSSGCYNWIPGKPHTLEGLKVKLAMCCNNPHLYSLRLEAAGMLAPTKVTV